MKNILVVEDDARIRANLVFQLREEGFSPYALDNAEDADVRLKQISGNVDLMLLDVRLEGMSGVALVEKLQNEDRLPPTIIISGEATISETVEALRLGVYDFIEKPFSRERLLRSIRNCFSHTDLVKQVRNLETKLSGHHPLLGESPAMNQLKDQIRKVGPTQGRVLIHGESGSGKELVANAIHQHSTRAKKPFIKINCAAIPANLIEDELFGHVRGAFTDAKTNKAGLFEDAHGGTLFLDEIGDMDLALQTRLLRVLEDGRVKRIGAVQDRVVNVRVISATHRDLETLVAEGGFRQDLFFRLSTIPLRVPSLRERTEDIPLLAEHFIHRCCKENHMRLKRIDADVFPILIQHPWPGNIREFKNLCERLVILGGDPITAKHLPKSLVTPGLAANEDTPAEGELPLDQNLPLKEFKKRCERLYIKSVLRACGDNYAEAAKRLGIQRTYLYQKAQNLQID